MRSLKTVICSTNGCANALLLAGEALGQAWKGCFRHQMREETHGCQGKQFGSPILFCDDDPILDYLDLYRGQLGPAASSSLIWPASTTSFGSAQGPATVAGDSQRQSAPAGTVFGGPIPATGNLVLDALLATGPANGFFFADDAPGVLDQISQHLEAFRPQLGLPVGSVQAQSIEIENEGRKLKRPRCHCCSWRAVRLAFSQAVQQTFRQLS
jgi:hypothetical protein